MSLGIFAIVLGACSSPSAPPMLNGDAAVADAADAADAHDGSTAGDGGADAADAPYDAPQDVTCNFTPSGNDPSCPDKYWSVANGDSCPSPGVRCAYPGEGDVLGPDGCPEDAYNTCVADDAGGAHWRKTQ